MLSYGLPFLAISSVEALVLTPISNAFTNIEQDSVAQGPTLDNVASTLLQDPSYTPSVSSVPAVDASLASNLNLSAVYYRCDRGLGINLNKMSCNSALSTIDYSDERELTWGLRGTGVEYDFPLPRRWVSCELLTAFLAYQNSRD